MAITQIEKVFYTAKAHTTGGREGGSSRSSDGQLDVKLAVPGTHGAGTNPEQLFAVGNILFFGDDFRMPGPHELAHFLKLGPGHQQILLGFEILSRRLGRAGVHVARVENLRGIRIEALLPDA